MSNAEPDQEVMYSISEDQDVFVVEGNKVVLKNALDFETQSMYNLTITAQDDGTPPAQVIYSWYLLCKVVSKNSKTKNVSMFLYYTYITFWKKN